MSIPVKQGHRLRTLKEIILCIVRKNLEAYSMQQNAEFLNVTAGGMWLKLGF